MNVENTKIGEKIMKNATYEAVKNDAKKDAARLQAYENVIKNKCKGEK